MTADYETVEHYLMAEVGVREAMAWRMMLSQRRYSELDFRVYREEADHILAICAPTEREAKGVSICSICGGDIGRCDHVPDKVYKGGGACTVTWIKGE